jgi:16S rRNA (guanine527-N7)-methyltransferase
MTPNEKKLTGILSRLGVPGAEEKTRRMLGYMDLALKRNEVMNLTAVTDESEFIERHLADSLAAYGQPELNAAREVADVGTGAGFPGVPLAIACPDKRFLLIDSLRKRTDFIAGACAKLGINNVEALHARVETVGRPGVLRESFDLALCRAVGHLSTLCEYSLPLVRVGGALYAYKSRSQLREIEESENARRILGAAADIRIFPSAASAARDTAFPYIPPAPDTERFPSLSPAAAPAGHIIIIIKKERPTPVKYPRRAGVPAKRTL